MLRKKAKNSELLTLIIRGKRKIKTELRKNRILLDKLQKKGINIKEYEKYFIAINYTCSLQKNKSARA